MAWALSGFPEILSVGPRSLNDFHLPHNRSSAEADENPVEILLNQTLRRKTKIYNNDALPVKLLLFWKRLLSFHKQCYLYVMGLLLLKKKIFLKCLNFDFLEIGIFNV